MQIAPVSFAGKKEIMSIAKDAGKLNPAQKALVDNAIKFHELEIDRTGDGDYLAEPEKARATSAALIDSLHNAGASKFAYLIAVDSLSAPVVRAGISPVSRGEIVAEALDIAGKADDVSKKDIISNVSSLSPWRY